MNSIVPMNRDPIGAADVGGSRPIACPRRFLGLRHPLYAAIAAVIVTDLSTTEITQLGW
jgi:hypothetical protein